MVVSHTFCYAWVRFNRAAFLCHRYKFPLDNWKKTYLRFDKLWEKPNLREKLCKFSMNHITESLKTLWWFSSFYFIALFCYATYGPLRPKCIFSVDLIRNLSHWSQPDPKEASGIVQFHSEIYSWLQSFECHNSNVTLVLKGSSFSTRQALLPWVKSRTDFAFGPHFFLSV